MAWRCPFLSALCRHFCRPGKRPVDSPDVMPLMQAEALALWAKDLKANVAEAQKIVLARARENGDAALGKWKKR